ncbi:hypothetical protein E0Z10_g9843 [Xylaria hypoxylon]|uniref:Uncharacterized protein n=1 Tax=Xylaria hypoxylon TaxID=37992 RepID=A0A4Z0YG53_9PEZI|nr:hypothetical protein E0Z10_g9843 [Xylaria hypoxylon]
MRIQWMLRNENSEIAISIARIEDCNRRMGVEMKDQFKEMRTEIIEKLEHLQADATVRLIAEPEELPNKHNDVDASDFQQISIVMHELSTRMSNLERSGQQANRLSLLLQSLHFDAIRSRHERIDEAHAKTFKWVLEPDPESQLEHTKFVEWLRGDQRIFWIRGKPGSGKSTLMKYLLQHPKIPENLKVWSGNSRLVIARYFFWNSGASLEKSQEGLLRSLLFDILRSFPELANTVEMARYNYGVPLHSTDEWSLHELLRAFETVSQTRVSGKFCFFIDGLDEYKGDTFELLRLVQKLGSALDLKLCVSSRPWTQFMDAFGGEKDLVIKLEDLTQRDIRRYVVESLQSNQRFQALAKDQVAYNNLAIEVALRAQGVFLWAKLVVHSLLQGATYADSLADMRRRVEEFPNDLEAYFEVIIADIPPRYLQKTALTVQIILAADQPLPLVMHYFIDELLSNPDFALNVRLEPMSEAYSKNIYNQMTARLDARFKGLLEVGKRGLRYAAFRNVIFIHRTAKDFLQTRFKATDDTLSTSNLYSILCHAALAMAKCTTGDVLREPDPIGMFLTYATEIREADIKSTKLDHVVRQIEEVEASHAKWSWGIFFQNALSRGWQWYVKEKITKASSPQALLESFIQFDLLFRQEVIVSGIPYWLIEHLFNRDAITNKDLICSLGECFVSVWFDGLIIDLYRGKDEYCLVYGLLCKFLASGLPLSTEIDGLLLTVRDYIAHHVTPTHPYGPELLRFLDEPSGEPRTSA